MAYRKKPYEKMEYQAIQSFANNRNAQLSLCREKICYFRDRANGHYFTADLRTVVALYKRRENAVKHV